MNKNVGYWVGIVLNVIGKIIAFFVKLFSMIWLIVLIIGIALIPFVLLKILLGFLGLI